MGPVQGLAATALLVLGTVVEAAQYKIDIKPYGEEALASYCGLQPSTCFTGDGCSLLPFDEANPTKTFAVEETRCRYRVCDDFDYFPYERLAVLDGKCVFDTDNAAKATKCGYGFQPQCASGETSVSILRALLRCNNSDDCREWTVEQLTSFIDVALQDGCVYPKIDDPQFYRTVYGEHRHVPAPSWLFPDAPTTPDVCVHCGQIGFPPCPTKPYCDASSWAATPSPASHCQDRDFVECGIPDKPSCLATGTLPHGDDDNNGCYDSNLHFDIINNNYSYTDSANCGGTCRQCSPELCGQALCDTFGADLVVSGSTLPIDLSAPPVDPPVDPPTGGSCASLYQKCGGAATYSGPKCCTDSLTCVYKKPSYSQCRGDAGVVTPPVDPPVDPVIPPSGQCVGLYKKCGGAADYRGPTCCQAGLVCVRKKPTYSQCRYRTGTVTLPVDPVDPAPSGQCASLYKKCGGAADYVGTKCCQAGLTCVYKKPSYSQCRQAS